MIEIENFLNKFKLKYDKPLLNIGCIRYYLLDITDKTYIYCYENEIGLHLGTDEISLNVLRAFKDDLKYQYYIVNNDLDRMYIGSINNVIDLLIDNLLLYTHGNFHFRIKRKRVIDKIINHS